ncbi:MAG: glycosyltransferase family 4 protein [Candidatus Bathyarchaeota archaeon]|nr:MAG: glycosyltransferase family 4 protein [Candidatus Bathyarchaeota archaeon]
MKILQVTKYYYPATSFGGPVQCTYNISKCLVEKGHEVTVYTTDAFDGKNSLKVGDKLQTIDGAEVFFFPNLVRAYGIFMSPSIIRAFQRKMQFDVVHLHEYRTFQNLTFHYFQRRKPSFVMSLHGEFPYSYPQDPWNVVFLRRLFDCVFGRRLLKDARRILALTGFEASQLIQSGVEKQKVAIVPNGIDPNEFSDLPPPGYFRKLFGISEEKIILYIGRLHKRKGLDVLLRAFSYLTKEQKNTKLVIAGPDDGYLTALQKMTKSLGLGGKVLFTGALSRQKVLAAFNDTTVTVYPSVHEGFAIVPLESGIMGKPIIVSDHPALNFVAQGKFGLTVERGNALRMKSALQRILEDDVLARELGKNGKKFVMNNFTWDSIVNEIENLYREICD